MRAAFDRSVLRWPSLSHAPIAVSKCDFQVLFASVMMIALLPVERGIVEQDIDGGKTDESRKSLVIANDPLERLKVWKQNTEFPANDVSIFAGPLKLARQPNSRTGFWRALDRAGKESGIGHIGTPTSAPPSTYMVMRHRRKCLRHTSRLCNWPCERSERQAGIRKLLKSMAPQLELERLQISQRQKR